MDSILSPSKEFWEEVLKKAEPYPDDDPVWNQFGRDVFDENVDMDRIFASFAKRALEGRL